MKKILAICMLCAAASARADIEPGRWQLTVKASIAGMGELQPMTRDQCLTAEDARDPSRVFGPTSNPNCTFSNRNDSGSEFTFNVSCSGPVPVTGSGRVRYSRDTIDAEMQLSGEAQGQKFTTTSTVSGRRTGSCQ